MTEEICGTCKYHRHIYTMHDGRSDHGWVCVNDQSENAGCYTDYGDSCDEWEGK